VQNYILGHIFDYLIGFLNHFMGVWMQNEIRRHLLEYIFSYFEPVCAQLASKLAKMAYMSHKIFLLQNFDMDIIK
jgi:hypothetical protein